MAGLAYRASVAVIVTFGQRLKDSDRAASSLGLMLSVCRVLTATHSVTYWHHYASAGGIHVAGSWSAFDQLLEADTAMSARLDQVDGGREFHGLLARAGDERGMVSMRGVCTPYSRSPSRPAALPPLRGELVDGVRGAGLDRGDLAQLQHGALAASSDEAVASHHWTPDEERELRPPVALLPLYLVWSLLTASLVLATAFALLWLAQEEGRPNEVMAQFCLWSLVSSFFVITFLPVVLGLRQMAVTTVRRDDLRRDIARLKAEASERLLTND
ncbi:hypothetical protein [Nocardia asteroides]|uniref:hypothetical protein n=1 Tax=Nocardia asteroides TaxID=1824 RepID=UPI003669D552